MLSVIGSLLIGLVVAAIGLGYPAGRQQGRWLLAGGTIGALGLVLAPEGTGSSDANSETLLVLINRDSDAQTFRLPPGSWRQICDSSSDIPFALLLPRQDSSIVPARSVQLLAQE